MWNTCTGSNWIFLLITTFVDMPLIETKQHLKKKITFCQNPLPKEAHLSEDLRLLYRFYIWSFLRCVINCQKWDLCPVPKPTVQLINYISRWFTADADPIWLGPWFIHTLDNIHWIYWLQWRSIVAGRDNWAKKLEQWYRLTLYMCNYCPKIKNYTA